MSAPRPLAAATFTRCVAAFARAVCRDDIAALMPSLGAEADEAPGVAALDAFERLVHCRAPDLAGDLAQVRALLWMHRDDEEGSPQFLEAELASGSADVRITVSILQTLADLSEQKGPLMPAADPLDLLDELAAIIDLVDCALAACGAFAATPVATVLGVASGRLGALKADFAALGQTSEGSHGE